MNRRDFIALTAGVATSPLALPLTAHAQQRAKKIPHIGIIDDGPIWQPYRQALMS